MIHRRRRPSQPPASPAVPPLSPLDDEDLLTEILIRLPPLPSSLPRASLACKRWRRLITDRVFLRRFRAHQHRKPPLLGFFVEDFGAAIFTPTLDPPDRIPSARFASPRIRKERWVFCGCRHGLALSFNVDRLHATVWDPLTGRRRHVAFPPGFDNDRENIVRSAAVLCASREEGHVHGDCHSSPFKLVLVRTDSDRTRAFACLYESESNAWGNIISTAISFKHGISSLIPSVLIGNALYWLIGVNCVLEFDLEKQSLVVMDQLVDTHVTEYYSFQILRTQDNGLGLAITSGLSIQLWERKSNSDGVLRWVLAKTLQLENLLELKPGMEKQAGTIILGHDEYSNAIFVSISTSVFLIQLESLQYKKVVENHNYRFLTTYYPYTNFYATGSAISGVDEEAEMLNNT
ncbi:hypothetical protein QYE76_010286 [Lolium multiflorum]|uniref:F-box domain-containing protein n=1 Tax=Lolium multiflorum TaxID=4521 RepID=A0AAD8X4H7_LOLMU|nr:hypothetical protein QYE76_010286 [Lolium multiflorum]